MLAESTGARESTYEKTGSNLEPLAYPSDERVHLA